MRVVRSAVVILVAGAVQLAPLAAQQRRVGGLGVSVGYLSSLRFTQDDSLNLDGGGNLALGVGFTVPVSARVALRMGLARTIDQRFTLSAPAFNVPETQGTLGVAHLGFSALFALPAGGKSTGAERFYVEAGAGLALTTFGSVAANGTSYLAGDFNTEQLAASLGGGVAIPVGRRATLDINARLIGFSSYGSRGLDEWNGASPPSHVKGKSPVALLLSVGVRHGRWS